VFIDILPFNYITDIRSHLCNSVIFLSVAAYLGNETKDIDAAVFMVSMYRKVMNLKYFDYQERCQ